MNLRAAQNLVRKNLGKSMIYYNDSANIMVEQAAGAFQEEVSYRKPETITMIHRMQELLPPGKRKFKYWEDVVRHYEQRKAGFFVCQVLAKKKIAIPLR